MTLNQEETFVQPALTGDLYFPDGVPGFETCKRFKIEEIESMPFFSMSCEDDDNVGFIVTSPWYWLQSFEVDLPDDACRAIGISTPEDAEVLAIVTVREPLEDATMNLAAPLVINLTNRQASQIILSNPEWSTRVSLKQEGVATVAGLG